MKGGCRSPGLRTQIHPSLRRLQLCRDRGPYGKEWEKAAAGAWAPGREGTGRELPILTLLCPKAGWAVTPEGQMETPGPQGWHRQDAKAGVGGAGCFSITASSRSSALTAPSTKQANHGPASACPATSARDLILYPSLASC